MWPKSHSYEIDVVTTDHPRRGVAFLISTDAKVTGKPSFDRLNINSERTLRTRFDAWRDRKREKKWYHGWDQSEFQGKYTKCFVFKCKEKRSEHRFYGFLYNPKVSDPGYQICVLVVHDLKGRWETDEANLRKVETIRTTFAVQKAINDYFKENL